MQGFEHKTLFYQQMQLTLLLRGPGLWKTMFSLYFALFFPGEWVMLETPPA